MKFTGLFTLALATTALATPAKRQSSPTELISTISDKVSALDSAVGSYSGGDPSKVQSASDDLVETINSAVKQVNSGDDLSSSDALALTSPIQDLTDQVDGVVTKIINKKDQFVDAGAGGQVKTALNDQYDAAKSLAEALSSKVPSALSDIADELSAGITDAIQRGIDAYKNVDDSAPTSSASSTSTATSSGSSETETATSTGSDSSSETETSTPTSSTPVIPTTFVGAGLAAVAVAIAV
ncbi:hydrophobic surface binding protein A-domain-containing protein [Aspergillus unguis]